MMNGGLAIIMQILTVRAQLVVRCEVTWNSVYWRRTFGTLRRCVVLHDHIPELGPVTDETLEK